MPSWSDDELHDDEYPDDWEDSDDEEETLTLPCPECGAEVYEDAEQCPQCGSYLTAGTHPFAGRSIIWIGLGLLGVVAVVWALTIGG